MKINLTTYHGNCDIVNVATQPNLPHFQLDASQLAEGELNPWKPLHELFIQLLLQVARLNILNHACDVGGEREEGSVFASTKPTIQGVWIVCLGQGLEGYRLKKVYFRGVSRVLLSSVETHSPDPKCEFLPQAFQTFEMSTSSGQLHLQYHCPWTGYLDTSQIVIHNQDSMFTCSEGNFRTPPAFLLLFCEPEKEVECIQRCLSCLKNKAISSSFFHLSISLQV